MSFITTKVHEILLSGFRGVALTKKTRTDGLADKLTLYYEYFFLKYKVLFEVSLYSSTLRKKNKLQVTLYKSYNNGKNMIQS